jgi:hypothetical protein
MILSQLSDDQLISNTHGAIKIETEATTNVVRHFYEIYSRDLYLARSYSSMYLMAMDEFGYDSSSALRRTHALELALAVPSILEKIDQGELCLQSAADIQTFLNKERGDKKIYTSEQKRDLVEVCLGLSTRKVQMELAGRNPEIRFIESKKIISKTQLRVTYVTKIATEEKLERIKTIRSHVNPYISRDELLDYMAERTLDQIDPLRKADRAEKREAKKPKREVGLPAQAVIMRPHVREEIVSEAGEIQLAVDFVEVSAVAMAGKFTLAKPKTRYVSSRTSRLVRETNQIHGCAFVDVQTGRRCGSKHQEQLDHILEFSKGGLNEPGNLQIYCARHNRYRWKMRSKSHVKSKRRAYG